MTNYSPGLCVKWGTSFDVVSHWEIGEQLSRNQWRPLRAHQEQTVSVGGAFCMRQMGSKMTFYSKSTKKQHKNLLFWTMLALEQLPLLISWISQLHREIYASWQRLCYGHLWMERAQLLMTRHSGKGLIKAKRCWKLTALKMANVKMVSSHRGDLLCLWM